MHQADGDGALAHRGSYASDRALPNVASGKDARHTGLQQVGVSLELPILEATAIVG